MFKQLQSNNAELFIETEINKPELTFRHIYYRLYNCTKMKYQIQFKENHAHEQIHVKSIKNINILKHCAKSHGIASSLYAVF